MHTFCLGCLLSIKEKRILKADELFQDCKTREDVEEPADAPAIAPGFLDNRLNILDIYSSLPMSLLDSSSFSSIEADIIKW